VDGGRIVKRMEENEWTVEDLREWAGMRGWWKNCKCDG